MIPWWVWAFLVAVGALWYYGDYKYDAGRAEVQALWDTQKAKDAAEIKRLKEESGKVTERVVTEYVDRVKVVREKGDTIIKQVPVYVTVENDAACTVNRGFVSLWNRSNKGFVSGAPARTDGEASEVRLSDIAAQHAREATICRSTETQLESLQDWVSEQRRVHQ